MSTWIGNPADRLSLRAAQSHFAEAARDAARPSWLWLVGICYPSVLVVPALGFRALQTGAADSLLTLVWLTFAPMVFPPLVRLIVGLARLAEPRRFAPCVEAHGRARLRDAWREGRGLVLPTLGLWCCVLLLDLALLSASVLVFQLLGGGERDWRAYLIGGPMLLFACAYAAVVSVLFQLALQSLAQNQRGVVSALQHGWRLARHDGWATARGALIDVASSMVLAVIGALIEKSAFTCLSFVAGAPYVGLMGILGVARALFWGRLYRVLGGLAPEDGVPGLAPDPSPPPTATEPASSARGPKPLSGESRG